MRRCSSLFDVVRIDHFRGFDQYYAIPAESRDARIGQWEEGPGIGLFRAIEKEIPGLTIIAEDLGYITDSVRKLVQDTGYPNMKVLEFAFDSRDSSGKDNYLPFNYDKNCVVYTGTHDNETMVGWLDHILPEERAQVRAFTGLDGREGDEWALGSSDETKRLARAMVRAAMASVGRLCVIPMQDWLLLGDEARINTPSTTGTNWCWRMAEGAASQSLAEQIRRMTETFGR
jgi:4-alpha-glucanotransferase